MATASETRVGTADHEAGHVLAYLDAGKAFRYVTINAKTSRCTGQVALNRPRRDTAHNVARYALAGPAAEAYEAWRRAVGPDLDGVDAEGAEFRDYLAGAFLLGGKDDLDTARGIFSDDRYLDLLTDDALDLVVRHWRAVETVAAALLASPRALTYRQVQALI